MTSDFCVTFYVVCDYTIQTVKFMRLLDFDVSNA